MNVRMYGCVRVKLFLFDATGHPCHLHGCKRMLNRDRATANCSLYKFVAHCCCFLAVIYQEVTTSVCVYECVQQKRKSFQTIAKLQMKMLHASAMETHTLTHLPGGTLGGKVY